MICVASSAIYLLLMQFLCIENIVRERDDAVLKYTLYRAKQIPFRPGRVLLTNVKYVLLGTA